MSTALYTRVLYSAVLNNKLYNILYNILYNTLYNILYREDGFADQGEWSPLDSGPSRADSFEYVMHGKIYRSAKDSTGKWVARGNSILYKIPVHFSPFNSVDQKTIPVGFVFYCLSIRNMTLKVAP